ncbi:hypothetical protein QTL95_26900 [Rhizobium sp. S152]|uniref:hypothetical protein n=1 Tax=Rhizobium sp. S152 TaxID=3055038 RepID=UPI0025A9A971|nr:hypothetical protein [Rhizobium sp. S152]MDM9629517.1 hypothetical protein [Rhizobium sp. S152]
MAKDTTKSGKTETLTIRLDPKTRFILEYMSRLKGQTITTVVERAIVAAAAQETVVDREYGHQLTWDEFWDVSEGVRSLNLASRREFFPTFEEERRLEFAKTHWPFFFATRNKTIPLNHYIDILWPRIDEFIQIHEDNKAQGGDWFGAGKAMQEALRKSNLKAPDWPVKEPLREPEKKEEPPKTQAKYSRDLDDDIPF